MAAFELPNITGGLDSAKSIEQLKNYLFMLTESLQFTLRNLDADNMSSEYAAGADYSGQIKELRNAVEAARQAAASARSLVGQLSRTAVLADGVIAAVNSSAEIQKIGHDRLSLDGMEAATASIGGVDFAGSGRADGLKVTGGNLAVEAASGSITLLGLDAAGNLCKCMAEIAGTAEEGYTIVLSAVTE